MPTNSYFTHGTSGEQNLVEELVIEQIKMFGQDVYYIPRVIVDEEQDYKKWEAKQITFEKMLAKNQKNDNLQLVKKDK
mgnify:CR=1 FL=1